MAAAASQDCLKLLPGRASGLFFASTTAPYAERLNASLIAAIADLSDECSTADFAGSLRAGVTALRLAAASAADGPIVVCAADTRDAAPGSDEEQLFADGAGAVAIGRENVIAEVVASVGGNDDFFDAVRRDRDPEVISYSSRFSVERGYQRNLASAIRRILQAANIAPAQVKRLVLNSPDRNSHLHLAKQLGFLPEQVQDIAWQDIGITGCAMPLILLADALESSQPGEYILLAAYGNGADAVLLRTTEAILRYRPRVSVSEQRKDGIPFASYALFRKARTYRRQSEENLEISNIFYAREEAQNIRLHGVECGHCGTRQLPQAHICVHCRKGDTMKEVALQRTGTVFTFAVDQLYPSPFPPTIMAVVDLDGGGRIYCEVVDVKPEDVRIGMRVELTIRRLKEGGGLHHYYWKCRPLRGA
jgi:3-hydroxy-3-methylglutaryl CoA synthase